MSIVTDFRAVSENAIEQLADRFDDLPRPLLAAIGAGDMAVEQLAALRESLTEYLSDPAHRPDVDKVSDLQAKAQQTATDYLGKAGEYVGQVQHTAAIYADLAQQTAQDYAHKAQRATADYVGKVQEAA